MPVAKRLGNSTGIDIIASVEVVSDLRVGVSGVMPDRRRTLGRGLAGLGFAAW